MLQKAHIQKYYSCKKYNPSLKDIERLENIINNKCVPISHALVKIYNTKTPQNLITSVFLYIETVLKDFSRSGYIDSRLYELHAMKNIIKNPAIITREYPNIKDKPNTHTMYTADLNRTQRLVLVNALDEISKIENFAKDNQITATTNINHVIINSENPKIIREAIELAIEILKQKNIKDKILIMLQRLIINCEKFIRNNEITSLTSLFDFFNSLGLLSSYFSLYELNSSKFGLADLDYNSSGNNNGEISLKETFSEDFLQALPIDDLCFLNAFWCNKFAKECNDLLLGFTAINSLDLWQDILNGKILFNIPNQKLVAILKKSSYLNQIASDAFNQHQDNITHSILKQGTNFSMPLDKDYTVYYKQLHNYINKDYTNYFASLYLPKNDFFDDFSFIAPIVFLKEQAYCKKENIIEPMVKSRLDNNQCKNWGLVRNEVIDGNYIDSLKSNNTKLLVAFDIEGFNMPFRFHMLRDDLLDLVKLNNSNYLIPEYQGNDDFVAYNNVENKFQAIPSNIIMPIPKRHKDIIKSHMNCEDPNKNLWEHLYFLADGTFPKHLTQTVQKNKKQTFTTRLPIIYSNLKTGQRYVKNKNKFIEVDDSNER